MTLKSFRRLKKWIDLSQNQIISPITSSAKEALGSWKWFDRPSHCDPPKSAVVEKLIEITERQLRENYVTLLLNAVFQVQSNCFFTIYSVASHSICSLAGSVSISVLIHLSTYVWLYSACGPSPLFQLLDLYTVDRPPWTGDESVTIPLPTHRTTQTQKRRTQTSMLWLGLEPTSPVFERVKTVHSLERMSTVIGNLTLATKN
jgi:hypothetical protein